MTQRRAAHACVNLRRSRIDGRSFPLHGNRRSCFPVVRYLVHARRFEPRSGVRLQCTTRGGRVVSDDDVNHVYSIARLMLVRILFYTSPASCGKLGQVRAIYSCSYGRMGRIQEGINFLSESRALDQQILADRNFNLEWIVISTFNLESRIGRVSTW